MIDIESIKELDKSKFYHVTINTDDMEPIEVSNLFDGLSALFKSHGLHCIISSDNIKFNDSGYKYSELVKDA